METPILLPEEFSQLKAICISQLDPAGRDMSGTQTIQTLLSFAKK